MTTPREKALELIYKYQNLVTTWDCYNDCPCEIEHMLPDMKECALITVNEILELLTLASDLNMLYRSEKVVYWQEVKKQIETY